MDLSTHRLTPGHESQAFGVWLGLVTLGGPRTQSVLYLLRSSPEASPKAISGRTSYFRVRLEFHPYPHLIPALFNVRGFGPPVSITSPSPWTGVAHTVSGLRPLTISPYSDSLSLRLRLPALTSQTDATRRFILQKARRHPLMGSDFLRAHGFRFFSLPSRGPFHRSLTVLFHYRSPGSI
jgi:hypothetical protein